MNSLILKGNRLIQSIHKVSPNKVTIKPSRNYMNGKRRDLNTTNLNEPIPNVLNQREKVSLIVKATLFTIGVSLLNLKMIFQTYQFELTELFKFTGTSFTIAKIVSLERAHSKQNMPFNQSKHNIFGGEVNRSFILPRFI